MRLRDQIEKDLAAISLRLIEIGALPDLKIKKLRAGVGTGSPCAVCTMKFLSSELVVRVDPVDWNRHADEPVLFHTHCFRAWQNIVTSAL